MSRQQGLLRDSTSKVTHTAAISDGDRTEGTSYFLILLHWATISLGSSMIIGIAIDALYGGDFRLARVLFVVAGALCLIRVWRREQAKVFTQKQRYFRTAMSVGVILLVFLCMVWVQIRKVDDLDRDAKTRQYFEQALTKFEPPEPCENKPLSSKDLSEILTARAKAGSPPPGVVFYGNTNMTINGVQLNGHEMDVLGDCRGIYRDINVGGKPR